MFTSLVRIGKQLGSIFFNNSQVGIVSLSHDLDCIDDIILATWFSVNGGHLVSCIINSSVWVNPSVPTNAFRIFSILFRKNSAKLPARTSGVPSGKGLLVPLLVKLFTSANNFFTSRPHSMTLALISCRFSNFINLFNLFLSAVYAFQ